jgi:Pregnancy-associated plasma protein-A
MKGTVSAAVATAALIGVAAAASPAAAALPSAVAGLACAPGTAVNQAFGAAEHSTARTVREPAGRGLAGDSEIPAGQEPSTSSSFTATIPVYFHVLAKSQKRSDGWVGDDQIRRQIEVLNAAFAGQYGGTRTGFRFVLEGVTRTINARWHDMATFADELEAKRALKVGDATTLNIYSTSISLGFAYYPKIVAGGYGGNQDADGVVIHFGSMPGGHIKNFNLGHTATHEVGHYLGLPHTFEQGCRGHGDYVDDTPAVATPTSGCPHGKDICPEPGEDPIHNYMDYSHDSCYTRGQATRMQQQYLHWRVKHGYSPPQT